jgi:hypothetical protein
MLSCGDFFLETQHKDFLPAHTRSLTTKGEIKNLLLKLAIELCQLLVELQTDTHTELCYVGNKAVPFLP